MVKICRLLALDEYSIENRGGEKGKKIPYQLLRWVRGVSGENAEKKVMRMKDAIEPHSCGSRMVAWVAQTFFMSHC